MRSVEEILDDMHLAMNRSDIEGVQRCIEEATAFDSREGIALVHHGRGWMANFASDYQQALAHYGAELELRRELGDLSGEAATIGNIGNVMIGRGRLADALEQFQRAWRIFCEGQRFK